MFRFSDWLRDKTAGWLALGALVLFVAFTALVLPRQAAEAEQASGSAGSPDTSLFYTADDLYGWAEAYGAAGRQAYVRARLTFDVLWPLVYTFFLVTALSGLLPRAVPAGSRWTRANLVPLLGLLFDYLENSATALVMARFPATTPVVDALAGPLTLLKWIFVGGSFALLLLALVLAVWRRLHSALPGAGEDG